MEDQEMITVRATRSFGDYHQGDIYTMPRGLAAPFLASSFFDEVSFPAGVDGATESPAGNTKRTRKKADSGEAGAGSGADPTGEAADGTQAG